jgi:hypothetical protein
MRTNAGRDGEVESVTDSSTKASSQTRARRLPTAKALLVGVIVLGLIGIMVVATLRESSILQTSGTGAGSGLEPVRPPLTAAEEAYATALWPIHSESKLSAVNMTFAGLAYKLGELDRGGLRSKLEPLAERFAEAAVQLRQLQPPASMGKLHGDYAEALRLYQASIAEMARVIDDGRDQHLIDAQAQSEKAAAILITLSDELWPGEYKPN